MSLFLCEFLSNMLLWLKDGLSLSLDKKYKTNFLIKANHLAYIGPRWYRSRISADCHQNLLSPKHDTGGRFLLVNILKEQKREDNTQGDNLLAGKWQRLR